MNSANSQTTFRKSYWIEEFGENLIVTFTKKETTLLVYASRAGEDIIEGSFIEMKPDIFRGNEITIYHQEFKRKGIYTFILDTIEKEFTCRVMPSPHLTEQGKRFWRNRKNKQLTHGKERITISSSH